MRESYGFGSDYSGKEFFVHTDEFNEDAMPELGSGSGEAIELEEKSARTIGTIAKGALVAVTAALVVMQVFHPRWMLIPDPVREVIGIGKHEHTPGEWVIDHLPTCTLSGYEYQKCSMCGEIIEEKTEPAKGHEISDEWVTINEPTCVELGEEARKCTVCGEILQVRGIPALGHKKAKDWVVTKKPTCTEKGEEVRKCTVCGEILETRTVAATGHKFGSWITSVNPTCTSGGSQYRKCTVCGYTEYRSTGTIDHNYVLVESVAATCESSGYRLYRCSMCGDSYRETIPAIGHSFAAAHNYASGPYAYCTRCGKTAEQLGYDDQYNEYIGSDGEMHERVIVYFPDGSYVYAYF